MSEDLHQRVDWNMTNHAPADDDVVVRFETLREFAKTFSHAIVDLCPEGRDQSLALTHAEDALMRAVAAIARNQDRLPVFSLPGDMDIPSSFESAEELEEIAAEVMTPRATAETLDEVAAPDEAPEPEQTDLPGEEN